MWARLNDNDTIAQLYPRPVGITLNGVQYPASIFSLWSASELKALKIWSVTMTNSADNSKWNTNGGVNYAVTKNGDTVTGVTGTHSSTEKPLYDVFTIPVASSDGFSSGEKVASSANYSSAGKKGNIISKASGVLDVEMVKSAFSNGNTIRAIVSDGSAAVSPAVSTAVSGDPILKSRGMQWTVIQEVKDIQSSKLTQHDWYYIRKYDKGTAVPSAVQTYRDAVRAKATDLETAISATTSISALSAIDTGAGWPSEI